MRLGQTAEAQQYPAHLRLYHSVLQDVKVSTVWAARLLRAVFIFCAGIGLAHICHTCAAVETPAEI